jgi:AMP-binding enzyme
MRRLFSKHTREELSEFGNFEVHLLEHVGSGHRAITNVDAVGVIERFTFAHVAREAAQWAHVLRGHGLQPGDRVVVLAGREWQWRCALIGVVRAGGVAVPCSSSLPVAEIRAIAKSAGAARFVSIPERPDLVEPEGSAVLDARALDAIDASAALEEPAHNSLLSDVALVLYAGGPAGHNGFTHTHASLMAQAAAGEPWLAVAEDEPVWCTAVDGSPESIWFLLAAWQIGAAVVNVELDLDPEGRLELLDRLGAAAVWFSDDEYGRLAEAVPAGWAGLGSLHRVLVSDQRSSGATAFANAVGAEVAVGFGVDRREAEEARKLEAVAAVEAADAERARREAAEAEERRAGEERRREEERRRAEEEAKRRAEQEAKKREQAEAAAAEERRRAEEARRLEEERRRAEEEAKRRAEEQARQREQAEAAARAEREAAAAEERRRAEEEAKRRAEQEAREREQAEAAARAEREAAAAEERRRAEEENRLQEERRREEEARRRAEQEARKRAEAAAAVEAEQAERARRKAAEDEKRRRAEKEKRLHEERRREEKAKRRAEQEARKRGQSGPPPRAERDAADRRPVQRPAEEARAAGRRRRQAPLVWPWQLLSLLLLLIIGALLGYFLDRPNHETALPLKVAQVAKRPNKSRPRTVDGRARAPAKQADRGAGSTTPGSVPEKKGSGQSSKPNASSGRVYVLSTLGLPRAIAWRKLEAAGFRVYLRYIPSQMPGGQVVGQIPAGETPAQAAKKVLLVISRGPYWHPARAGSRK